MTVTWHCFITVLCEVLIEKKISVQNYEDFIRNLIIYTDFTKMKFSFHESMLNEIEKITCIHVMNNKCD
jgi:hypothetical protein